LASQTDDHDRAVLGVDEHSVWQAVPGQHSAGRISSLAVQLVVHILGVRCCAAVGLAPRLPVGVVVVAAAFGAWAVTGGQRHGLVEKEQLGVVIGRPLRGMATLEFQQAGDPGFRLMVTHDVAGTATFV